MGRLLQVFCLYLIFCCGKLSPPALGGPVNSRSSFPHASMNERGDTLTIGDRKGLFIGRGPFDVERTASLRLASDQRIFPRFSGGLADARKWSAAARLPFAIACSNREVHLLYPERSPAYPGGRWEALDAKRPAQARSALVCAMQENGSFAWLDIDRGSLVIDGQVVLPLPFVETNSQLLAVGESYWILGPSSQSAAARKAEAWAWTAIQKHPFGRFGELTRFASNERGVLRADGDRVQVASLKDERWGEIEKLPVQPCESNQACGVSLAADDSWAVSGYWGHYLGKGSSFQRLRTPISVPNDAESYGVAFAHQGLGGRFVYLGDFDGDQGKLPAWKPSLTRRAAEERWLVWSSMPTAEGLFPIKIERKLLGSSADTRGHLQLSIWRGSLPSPIPSHWVAWEASEALSPLPPLKEDRGARAKSFEPYPWWHEYMGVRKAHETAAKLPTEAISVAIVDSGIDLDHPWLKQLRDTNPDELPSNGLDDDGNGLVDDTWGYDFVDEDSEPDDQMGHGTHVAGLLMAANGKQFLTPAPNLRLKVIKIFGKYGEGNSIDLVRGLYYAVESGAEVINCSWGGGPLTEGLRDVFDYIQSRGRLVIMSAGNNKLDNDSFPEFPKNHPAVLAVAGLDQRGGLSSSSNYGGKSVQWLAPGDEIFSTLRGSDWGLMSGTSMAAPLVTSSLAWIWGLLRARHPEEDSAPLRELAEAILCKTANRSEKQAGRSRCGAIRLDLATEEALKTAFKDE